MSCVSYPALATANIGFQKGGAKPSQATRSKTWSKRGGGEKKNNNENQPTPSAHTYTHTQGRIHAQSHAGQHPEAPLPLIGPHVCLWGSPGNKAGLRGGERSPGNATEEGAARRHSAAADTRGAGR